MTSSPHGIAFPSDSEGRRSTTSTGRAVVADALRPVDPVGARAAEQEPAWRSGYVHHLRRLVEAGLGSSEDWVAIARAGLASVGERMVTVRDGADAPVAEVLEAPSSRRFGTREVTGTGQVEKELVVPYDGRELRGDALRQQLRHWAARGALEPSAADAAEAVIDHPEWLACEGWTVAVLGAGAEMGPLGPLLRWGATVAAVDLPRPQVWERVLGRAERGAGRLLAPEADGRLGADLLDEVPEVAAWLQDLDGRLLLGTYVYADGATHVRVSAAADLLGQRLRRAREDTGLAFLATPTDAFVVPRQAVEQADAAYTGRTRTAKVVGRPLRWASRGRLLHRNYEPSADPGICDALVPVQGPSYALAKRIQRWRATVARHEGATVSFHVAPSSRTRSVVKNRALAAAYAGAHRFGIEIFEPATANALMAALLVHDLHAGVPRHDHPWQDEAWGAVHGGLWRSAYAPRSALGLSAVLGYAAARG